MTRMMLLAAVVLLAGWQADAATVKQEWQLDGFEHDSGDFFEQSIRRLAKLPGFSCRFDQLMMFTDGGGQHYAGSVAVRKPGYFRWEYQKPYSQLYLGDGKVIWHYEPDLMQAERLDNLEAVDPTVMRLLDGRVKIADIRVFDSAYDAKLQMRRFLVSIETSPKVWLGFSKYGDLISIEREDMLGNRNRMQLSKCAYVAPAANLFSFTPPKETEVLDLRSTK